MNIKGFSIKPTSMTGQSLLVSRDTERFPIISLQLPTAVALEIKKRWDFYDDHFQIKVSDFVVYNSSEPLWKQIDSLMLATEFPIGQPLEKSLVRVTKVKVLCSFVSRNFPLLKFGLAEAIHSVDNYEKFILYIQTHDDTLPTYYGKENFS